MTRTGTRWLTCHSRRTTLDLVAQQDSDLADHPTDIGNPYDDPDNEFDVPDCPDDYIEASPITYVDAAAPPDPP